MINNLIVKLIAVSIVGFLFSLPTIAAPDTELTKKCKPLINKAQKIENPPLRGMTERDHKKLTRALEFLAEDKYDEGIAALKVLLDSSSDDYVKSAVSMNIASAYAQQNNYKEALPFFEKALQFGEGQLDHDRLQGLRQNVASLLYSIGKKDESIALLKTWLSKSIKDDSKVYILLSVIYAEMGRYKDAICPAYFAILHENTPKSNYYSVLLVSHFEMKDLVGSATILKDMVALFPDEKSYWRQLSSLYMQMDKVKESLAIMEMFYLKGDMESESDYKTLSSLFAYEEVPYRSAQILEEGVNKGIVKPEEKNLKSVANNYRVSKDIDKAIIAYGRSAEVADDGEHYLTQAELYAEKEDWKDVIKSLDKAIAKGVDDEGRVFFTKGSAEASLKKCGDALKSLEKATKYKSWRSRATAWIDYIKDQQKHNKC